MYTVEKSQIIFKKFFVLVCCGCREKLEVIGGDEGFGRLGVVF